MCCLALLYAGRMLDGTVVVLVADLLIEETIMKFVDFLSQQPPTPLRDLTAQAYQELVASGRGYCTVYEISRYWRQIMDYATTRSVDTFSLAFVEEYLAVCQQRVDAPKSFVPATKHALRVLLEFQQAGQLLRLLCHPQDQETLFTSPQTPLETVMAQYYQAMAERGYPNQTLYEVSRICRHLTRFAESQGIDTLSPGLVETYLVTCREIQNIYPAHLLSAIRVLRRLLEFQQTGSWRQFPLRREEPVLMSAAFVAALEDFLRYWEAERRVSRHTYQYGRRYIVQFLSFLESCGVQNWSQLSAPLVGEFVTSNPEWSARSRQLVASTLRVFFKYLFVNDHVDRDWSGCLPTFRRGEHRKLPAIWTEDDLAALLTAVEQTSAIGKRDYAILLLACRLGMRISDIRTLSLDDIHWDEARLEFIQKKTGERVVLPLPSDVGESLIAYLRDARPVTEYRQVFLRHIAPYQPFADDTKLHAMISKYRQRAGISRKPGQACGMHSLRHTFATKMQKATVPLETIASLLGHQSLDSTRIYVRIDVPALRQVALDPEEVEHVG